MSISNIKRVSFAGFLATVLWAAGGSTAHAQNYGHNNGFNHSRTSFNAGSLNVGNRGRNFTAAGLGVAGLNTGSFSSYGRGHNNFGRNLKGISPSYGAAFDQPVVGHNNLTGYNGYHNHNAYNRYHSGGYLHGYNPLHPF